MSATIRIHGIEWKQEDIEDNVDWARAQEWTLIRYDISNEHEHCLICFWTIFESDDPQNSVAYCSGGSSWLCIECHTKFLQRKQ